MKKIGVFTYPTKKLSGSRETVFTVSLYTDGNFNGKEKIFFECRIGKWLLYKDDFLLSPLVSSDSIDCFAHALGFIMLKSGSVDEDFWDSIKENMDLHEIAQYDIFREWVNNSKEAEEICFILSDFEMVDDEEYLKENELDKDEVYKAFAERIELL